jgi:hypothetical protein
MNINTVEQPLAKYHVLHLVIGAVLTLVLLATPKLFGVLFIIALVTFFLPLVILPDFARTKWLDRGMLILGAVLVAVLFHFLGKL